MDCDLARTALSAMLDGEEPGVDQRLLERHVAGCGPCADWSERAAELVRLVRVTPAVPPGPDLSDVVLAHAPMPGPTRARRLLGAALAVVAVAQLAIGLWSLFRPVGMPAGMVSAHLDHETAAFNVALGIALLVVARNTGRAAAQLPVLASFVGVLAVASVIDLADGSVGWARLATHLPVVAGLALVVALGGRPGARTDPGGTAAPAPQPAAAFSDRSAVADRFADQRQRPTARHRGAA